MDIRIIKADVTYCAICDEVSEMKKQWDTEQQLAIDDGRQEEATRFKGVPGYIVKDADDYKFSHSEICEQCMHTLMRGVTIIHEQNLTGISLHSQR